MLGTAQLLKRHSSPLKLKLCDARSASQPARLKLHDFDVFRPTAMLALSFVVHLPGPASRNCEHEEKCYQACDMYSPCPLLAIIHRSGCCEQDFTYFMNPALIVGQNATPVYVKGFLANHSGWA